MVERFRFLFFRMTVVVALLFALLGRLALARPIKVWGPAPTLANVGFFGALHAYAKSTGQEIDYAAAAGSGLDRQRLAIAFASGHPPDLVLIDRSEVSRWVGEGVLGPIARNQRSNKVVEEGLSFGEMSYAVPYQIEFTRLFLNLDDWGGPAPEIRTREDLERVVKTLKAKFPQRIVFADHYAQRDQAFDLASGLQGLPTFGGSEQVLADWATDLPMAYAKGDILLKFDVDWSSSEIVGRGGTFREAVYPSPFGTMVGGTVLVLPKNAESRAKAFQLLEFLISPEGQRAAREAEISTPGAARRTLFDLPMGVELGKPIFPKPNSAQLDYVARSTATAPDEKTFRDLGKVAVPQERNERKVEGMGFGFTFAVCFLTGALVSRRRDAYKFLIPLGVGLCLFVLGPTLDLVLASFHNDGLTQPGRLTLQPYAELFTPGQARSAIVHALVLALVAVPVIVGLTGWIATELRKRPGFAWIFAMPSMIPAVAAAICWGWIFFPAGQAGLANLVVQAMGLKPRSWLLESDSATLAVFSTLVWSMLGSSLVWLGALREVPANLIDAADLDGAEGWDRWRSTYWPSLRWAVAFIALGVLLACLQSFETTEIFRTNSATVGPDDILRLPGSHLFDAAFRDFNMGRAAAMGVAMGVIGLAAGIGVLKLAQGRAAARRGD